MLKKNSINLCKKSSTLKEIQQIDHKEIIRRKESCNNNGNKTSFLIKLILFRKNKRKNIVKKDRKHFEI